MDSIVKIENLSHKYAQSWAVKGVNLEIKQTGIMGLLGANGAGKSTTMNILCGVLKPTQGKVHINGFDIRKYPEAAKKYIGFLPQVPPLYLDLTVNEYLTYCANLRLMQKKDIRRAVEKVKERCGIAHFGRRLLKNLSGGYRQRVGIAQAIVHQPKLVVLDEPTNGLDPNQIVEIRGLITEIAEEHAVIFSSHILSEVQLICKEIKMISAGEVVFEDTMEAFNNYIVPNSVSMFLENPPSKQELLNIPGTTRVEFLNEKQIKVYFNGDADISERIVRASVQQDWRLREISLDKISLDETFAQLSNYQKYQNK